MTSLLGNVKSARRHGPSAGTHEYSVRTCDDFQVAGRDDHFAVSSQILAWLPQVDVHGLISPHSSVLTGADKRDLTAAD